MSIWPFALVRRIDRRFFAGSAAKHWLLHDACQQLYTLGWDEVAPWQQRCRTVSAAIRLVLVNAGLRRIRGTRTWAQPEVDLPRYAAAHRKVTPRRAWHARNDRRRTWTQTEIHIMEEARGKVGYARVAEMLGRTRDQVIGWYRRREGRRSDRPQTSH